MVDSVCASQPGLHRVDQARRHKNWNKTASIWCEAAFTSRATLSRFWAGQPIRREIFIAICDAVHVDWRTVSAGGCDDEISPRLSSHLHADKPSSVARDRPDSDPRCKTCPPDWGDEPTTDSIYGRQNELATLEQWIFGSTESPHPSGCMVSIIGMGGMGKTSLAAWFSRLHQHDFDRIIWRNLRNAPAVETLVVDITQHLSAQQLTLPNILDGCLPVLLHHLREQRCLLVFDNVESILKPGDRAGNYRDGYEKYEQLFTYIGESSHQSCLMLTSREQPSRLSSLPNMHCLSVDPLSAAAGQQVISHHANVHGDDADFAQLVNYYGGNPLALKLIAPTICDSFDGDISHFLGFLEKGIVVFDDIRDVLDQQFYRLSELEQTVMHWLAINREPVSLVELVDDVVHPVSTGEIIQAIASLQRRSLIETFANANGCRYTQQSIVMDYVTHRLIKQITQDVMQLLGFLSVVQSPKSLNTGIQNADESYPRARSPHRPSRLATRSISRYAVLKAQAPDYIRDTQAVLIAQPILNQLRAILGASTRVEQRLVEVLVSFRGKAPHDVGYAGGNLVNLLRQLGACFDGYDLSHLALRQADLRGELHRVNLSHAYVSQSAFTESFGVPLAIAFSPDGQHLVTGDAEGQVRIWNRLTGQLQHICKRHDGWIWAIAVSPDGTRVASGGDDQTIKVWNMRTGQCEQTLEGHVGHVSSLVFSADGNTLLSSSEDYTIKEWDLMTGRCQRTLTGHGGWVRAIALCPDGMTLISGSEDRTIKVWNLATGNCDQTLSGHTDRVWSVAVSMDGEHIASSSSDRTVKIWNIKTGTCSQTLHGHTNWIRAIALSPDGKILASGSEDKTIKLWDIESGTCLSTLHGHTNWIRSVAFSPDGHSLASSSGDHTVKLWNVCDRQCSRTLHGYTNRVWAVAVDSQQATTRWRADSIIASGNDGATITVWKIGRYSSDRPYRVLRGHTSSVCSVAVRSHLLASGSDDQTVKLWNIETGECVQTFCGHTSRVWSVAFGPDGKTLASSSEDSTVKLWDIESGQCTTTLRGHTSWVCSVAFSPTGHHLVTGSYDQTAKIWDLRTNRCVRTLKGHDAWVWAVAFSPDGQLIATGSGDHTVKLWDINQASCVQTFYGHTSRVWSVAFSPNGRKIASASSDRTVKIWDIETGTCYRNLHGHTNLAWSVAFSGDGRTVISGSQDETVRLWHLPTGNCRTILSADKIYAGTTISGIQGLTDVQQSALIALGAIAPSREVTRHEDIGGERKHLCSSK
ncbi:MAG: NB-ARC domain-containing protein [Elainellaceae cyanobacterium]